MNYDYVESKAFCKSIGLVWLGDDFVRAADEEAFKLNFTQDQIDAAMRHHFWQVKFLFDPKSYKWYKRPLLAWHFLFGRSK